MVSSVNPRFVVLGCCWSIPNGLLMPNGTVTKMGCVPPQLNKNGGFHDLCWLWSKGS